MNAKVTAIQSHQGKGLPFQGEAECVHVLRLPISSDLQSLLTSKLNDLGLESDQRALWLGYPNLKAATMKLLGIYSVEWPSSTEDRSPAVVKACREAIKRVKEGVASGDNTRAMVVSNYLNGLATIADDTMAVRAWGYHGNRAIEEWPSESGTFPEWLQRSGFSEVRFFARTGVHHNEMEGTRMKLLCSIATAKDVGVVARYR